MPPLKKSAAIPLRVLFIGSNGADASLAELERGGYEPAFEAISSAAELVEALSGSWDLAISDFAVGDFGAIAALNLIQEKGVDLPLIERTLACFDEASASGFGQGDGSGQAVYWSRRQKK